MRTTFPTHSTTTTGIGSPLDAEDQPSGHLSSPSGDAVASLNAAADSITRLRGQRGNDRANLQRAIGGPSTSATTEVSSAEVDATAAGKILKDMSLFRGVTDSPAMSQALEAMLKGEPTVMPMMWGFRQYTPEKKLASKESLTLDSFAKDIQKLNEQHGLKVTPMLLLADLHAEHNNVPAEAVPPELGGNGNEGYRAYYAKVLEEASNKGIHAVFLSEVFNTLKLTPEQVAQAGASLTHLPGSDAADSRPGAVHLTDKDVADYATQAEHMVQRYASVPKNREILEMSEAQHQAAIRNKELAYIHFRAGEGQLLLPKLGEALGTNVVPVHISDPSAGKIGVTGLYLHSKDYKDRLSKDIPWKEDPKTVSTRTGKVVKASTLTPEQIAALKLVKSGLRITYGSEQHLATRVTLDLFAQGLRGDDLVAGVRTGMVQAKDAQAQLSHEKWLQRKDEEERLEIKDQVTADHPDWDRREVKQEAKWRQLMRREGLSNFPAEDAFAN